MIDVADKVKSRSFASAQNDQEENSDARFF